MSESGPYVVELGLRVRPQSWTHEGLLLGPSAIHGQGVFAGRPFAPGERLIEWGGSLFTEEAFVRGGIKPHTVVQLTEGVFLGAQPDAPSTLDDFMNHSCAPNAVLFDALTLSAWRPIEAGEEIVGDYSTWMGHAGWRMKQPCNCGHPECRTIITGDDWARPDLQRKYGKHFSPYLLQRAATARKG